MNAEICGRSDNESEGGDSQSLKLLQLLRIIHDMDTRGSQDRLFDPIDVLDGKDGNWWYSALEVRRAGILNAQNPVIRFPAIGEICWPISGSSRVLRISNGMTAIGMAES